MYNDAAHERSTCVLVHKIRLPIQRCQIPALSSRGSICLSDIKEINNSTDATDQLFADIRSTISHPVDEHKAQAKDSQSMSGESDYGTPETYVLSITFLSVLKHSVGHSLLDSNVDCLSTC